MVLVPLSELMERWGYSESWWRARIAEGMPGRKWGARWRFDPDEIERWLDARYGSIDKDAILVIGKN